MRCTPNTATVSNEPAAIPRRWLIAPLVVLAALLAMETTGTDLAISHWFYDAAARTFPLRHTFLLDTVLHHWIKYVIILTTCVIAAAYTFTYVAPALRNQRRLLLFLALAMALAPLTVSALKQVTDRPCPWDLVDFGGDAPYAHLFEARAQSHGRGLCFPAGHAATGFALMAFFFAAHRQRRPALARTALLAGTLAGLGLGVGRVAQGAHFLSHVLWSGLICWVVMVGLYALLIASTEDPFQTRRR